MITQSLLRLVLLIRYPRISEPAISTRSDTSSTHSLSEIKTSNNSTFTYTVAAICITHALLFLIPTCLLIRPSFTDYDLGTDLFVGYNYNFNTIASTLFALLQFPTQFSTLWTLGHPEALSRWTLGLQIPVFLLLSVAWNYRLDSPFPPDTPPRRPGFWGWYYMASYWYFTIGWPVMNYASAAFGQAVLFTLSSFMDWPRNLAWVDHTGSSFHGQANERTALLREL